ncbi:Aspartyl-tRNA synthetase-Aspartate--tRNA ligase [Moritella viscosa]|uniref:Aspartyl-tRNA synthetase-Aspartate--tRNA ligase n=1 Tax=Moritella viscosa TaxID=80854 RepID=A0A1L0DXJ2_9GAMM|nr:hypothetical protein [Moritella viscosa]SGY94723.1 Aspartyl-tRNA synthetase-Aspartate--tRNA ligase [Moritella viscosa]SHO23902.1 Aspartyl-tRNA synthetase-Aspartate--tRNA ligase [Moritella viscosa]
MTKNDNQLLDLINNIDIASTGASLVENENVNPIERDRSPTKGNNKLLTSLPETLEADFYQLKASGLVKGSYTKFIIEALIEKTDRELNRMENQKREQV